MRILLVEDSRAVSTMISARLREQGYRVIVAENGREALDRFLESPPDLALMDIEMPVMNGFEAAKRIRAVESTQRWAWTPIIFLTASDTPENLVTAIEAGGDDFIAKSAPEAVLQAKMKAMTRIAALRAQLSQAHRRLEVQASQDGLTGLFNRRYMDEHLDRQWQDAERHGASFGLLMVDVDNFKKYNDHYGHLAGDDCLRAVARTLEMIVDKANLGGLAHDAIVARYGGEEFAVVLPRCAAEGQAALARRIVEEVRSLRIPHAANGDWGVITLSLGGAYMRRAAGKLGLLFGQADARLYEAKDKGRNCAVLG